MSTSVYTPLGTKSDDELILDVCSKDDATHLEVELMSRLIYWKEYAETMEREHG